MEARPSLGKRSSFPALHVPRQNVQSQLVEISHDQKHRSFYGYTYPSSHVPAPPQNPMAFDSSWPLLGGAWAVTDYGHFIATNTINEENVNRIHILSASQDAHGGYQGLSNVADAAVYLPQTKVAWDPLGANNGSQLQLLSTGDCLRLWNLNMATGKLDAVSPLVKRSKSNPDDQPAPLTSFDWNNIDNSIAITSSIDTTCTVWDLNTKTVRTQLIAHDSDVYDVAFLAQTPHKFVSVGADGSARVFDLRALDNSTIIFELPPKFPGEAPAPLLRVAANPTNSNLLACIAYDSPNIYVLDVRSPRNPASVLEGHQGAVNSIQWAPAHVGQNCIVSGGDDCQALVWDVSRADRTPTSAFTDSAQINSAFWCPTGEYLGITSGRTLQAIGFNRY